MVTGHTLHCNCLLKHVIEGKIERTGRRGRRRKQLLDELSEKRRHCKSKEEALRVYRTVWRTGFGNGCVPVLRQNAKWMNKQQLASYGAETWMLRKVYQKYLERSEMWFWRRMEKISWFLISNFLRVLYVVYLSMGNSLAFEFYMPTFRNTLSVPSS